MAWHQQASNGSSSRAVICHRRELRRAPRLARGGWSAAISACTHGPRPVSIPTSTWSASASPAGGPPPARAGTRSPPRPPGAGAGRAADPARLRPPCRDGPRPSHPNEQLRRSHLILRSTAGTRARRRPGDLMDQCSSGTTPLPQRPAARRHSPDRPSRAPLVDQVRRLDLYPGPGSG
jgi:hypothetical protein